MHYKNYGGRGICVCDEWLNDFCAFKDWALQNGYQDSLSIDRIDVNGNYTPSNCRWATQKEQSNNSRFNRLVWIGSEYKTVAELADMYRIKYTTMLGRVNAGKTGDELIAPVKKYNYKHQKRNENCVS